MAQGANGNQKRMISSDALFLKKQFLPLALAANGNPERISVRCTIFKETVFTTGSDGKR
jgi:hypothetical protein